MDRPQGKPRHACDPVPCIALRRSVVDLGHTCHRDPRPRASVRRLGTTIVVFRSRTADAADDLAPVDLDPLIAVRLGVLGLNRSAPDEHGSCYENDETLELIPVAHGNVTPLSVGPTTVWDAVTSLSAHPPRAGGVTAQSQSADRTTQAGHNWPLPPFP